MAVYGGLQGQKERSVSEILDLSVPIGFIGFVLIVLALALAHFV